jgi:hypothetical protein
MEQEKIIQNLRFGITVTSEILTFHNIRIPIEIDGTTKDVYIEADNESEASKIAELIEHGGVVDIKEQL